MKIIESNIVVTQITKQIKLDRQILLELIAPYTDCGDIPQNAEIYIMVPGGGDWSNQKLDVNINDPIVISWQEVTTG